MNIFQNPESKQSLRSRHLASAVPYLVHKAGEEGVRHIVVEKRPLVHQDALNVLAEGRIFTQQLHTRFRHYRLEKRREYEYKQRLMYCSLY